MIVTLILCCGAGEDLTHREVQHSPRPDGARTETQPLLLMSS